MEEAAKMVVSDQRKYLLNAGASDTTVPETVLGNFSAICSLKYRCVYLAFLMLAPGLCGAADVSPGGSLLDRQEVVAAFRALVEESPSAAGGPRFTALPNQAQETVPGFPGGEKLGARLRRGVDALRVQQEVGETPPGTVAAPSPFRYVDPAIKTDPNGKVRVYLYVTRTDQGIQVLLAQMGVNIEILDAGLGMIQALIDPGDLDDVAELNFVTRISVPSYASPNTGSVVTEGDVIIRSDYLRTMGIDGTGIKVGIITDGANDSATAVLSGDLPVGITKYGSCVKQSADPPTCTREELCNEGTALAEIIHDIAPGAEIAVGSASTSLEFIARINDLVNGFGASVVFDDLGFLAEPYFEDGPIASAMAAITDDVVVLSAAGNSADQHHESSFIDYDPGNPAINWHDFGVAAGSASFWGLPVYAEQFNLAALIVQWNDRFGQSSNDYNLFVDVYDAVTNDYLGSLSATDPQTGSQDPLEFLGICPPMGNPVFAIFYVGKVTASDHFLETFAIVRGASAQADFFIPEGSSIGQAVVPGVLGVGAIRASDPGNDEIEFFSSQGPARIFYPQVETRQKPDIAGIDGVSVTGAGGFPAQFFGTSAAAPHVAGIAALLLNARPQSTPEEIRNALRKGAVDLGDPGPDNVFGWGRADAVRAHGVLQALDEICFAVRSADSSVFTICF